MRTIIILFLLVANTASKRPFFNLRSNQSDNEIEQIDIRFEKLKLKLTTHCSQENYVELLNLSQEYLNYNLPIKARVVLSFCNSIKKNFHSEILEGKYLHMLGASYLGYENDSCFYLISKSKNIFIKHDLFEELSDINYLLSNCLYFTNSYYESQKYALESLRFAKVYKNELDECNSITMIAMAAQELGLSDISLKYHYQALALIEKYEFNKFCYARENCLNNIGYVYYTQKKYSQSLKFYYEALRGLEMPKHFPQLYARLLENIASAKNAIFKSNPLKHYTSANHIRSEFKVKDGRNYNYLLTSSYYLEKGNIAEAIKYGEMSLNASRDFNAFNDALIILKHLHGISSKKTYFLQYQKLNDSLRLADKRTKNKFARIAFEADELQKANQQARIKQWTIAGVGIGVTLLLILALRYKLIQAKRRRAKIHHEQCEIDDKLFHLIQDQEIAISKAKVEEKHKIAQELHDDVMNRLASTRLNLFSLKLNRDDETKQKSLEFIKGIARIENDLSKISDTLADNSMFQNSNFTDLIASIIHDQQQIAEHTIILKISKDIEFDHVDLQTKINLYRVLQESLNNCRKYASASKVIVDFQVREQQLHMCISDDGVGLTKKVHHGIGIQNMKRRIAGIEGEIIVRSPAGKGTSIEIAIPYDNNIYKSA